MSLPRPRIWNSCAPTGHPSAIRACGVVSVAYLGLMADLVEASPRDRIWGIGMGQAHEHATDPTRWRGANLLGFALMHARDLLRGGLT